MPEAPYIEIPLRNRAGDVVAYALIDTEDAAQAKHRWCRDSNGYVLRNGSRVNGVRSPQVYLHREVLGLVPGDGLEADHKDRDAKLDNRRANLRVVTTAQNRQNVGSLPGSTSKHRGVSLFRRTGKWQAIVQLNGRTHHLGYFASEEEAAAAASAWRAANMPYAVESTG